MGEKEKKKRDDQRKIQSNIKPTKQQAKKLKQTQDKLISILSGCQVELNTNWLPSGTQYWLVTDHPSSTTSNDSAYRCRLIFQFYQLRRPTSLWPVSRNHKLCTKKQSWLIYACNVFTARAAVVAKKANGTNLLHRPQAYTFTSLQLSARPAKVSMQNWDHKTLSFRQREPH